MAESRFIFGLRTIAGLLAGTLGMGWRRFSIFNVLGAAAWATTILFVGYGFGTSVKGFTDYFEYVSWSIAGAFFLIAYLIWRRCKKSACPRDLPT